MDMNKMTLQQLYFLYKSTNSDYKKNKVLENVFKRYKSMIESKAVKFSKKFGRTFEVEDFISVMQFGICRAFSEKRCDSPIEKDIFKWMRHELSRMIQPLFSKKNGVLYESDYIEDISEELPVCYEKEWIVRHDIKTAIHKLSNICKKIIILFINGFNIREIALSLRMIESTAYYKFSQAREHLKILLGPEYCF